MTDFSRIARERESAISRSMQNLSLHLDEQPNDEGNGRTITVTLQYEGEYIDSVSFDTKDSP